VLMLMQKCALGTNSILLFAHLQNLEVSRSDENLVEEKL